MKKLLNNIGMKLLSVLIAFLIWVVVVSGDDPEITKPFTVKVTTVNTDSMFEANKVFNITEGGETTIYVTARRSILNALTASDFTATADMESINHLTTVPSVPLVPSCSRKGVTIRQENMRCDPSSMKISIEDKVEKSFMISTITSGTPASGYEVGSTKLYEQGTTNSIRGETIVIAGPDSTLKKIDKVTATVGVSGMASNETRTVTLKIYDKNGDQVDVQLSNLEIKTADGVVLKDAKVDVKVTLWQVQSDIQFEIGLKGEVAEGYHITGVYTTPETITLAGSKNALKELNGVLSIPNTIEDAIDVTGISSTLEQSIDLEGFIQDHLKNIRLAKDAVTTVSVKVQVEKIDATTINKPISELIVKGQPESMNMVLTPGDKLPIEIQSEEKDTTVLQSADVQATLDLTGYESEGTYTVPVQIVLPEGYTLVNDVNIVVDLKLKEIATEEETTVLEE
ncbi:MAG: CdaR family protein [Candidatus Limivivens sp.]|nr:CdaR family protein [Candidatus Limivivens sp.]